MADTFALVKRAHMPCCRSIMRAACHTNFTLSLWTVENYVVRVAYYSEFSVGVPVIHHT